jgi:ABC-type sugar transport system permease subunit
VTSVAIETVLGVAMALVMQQAFRGRGLVRASILVPWAIPTAVSALLWRWIFQADGVANVVIGHQVLWTTEGFHAKVAVIIADAWKTAPFIGLLGLLVLAGLQTIPREVYEAAMVGGCTRGQAFRKIIIPLAAPGVFPTAIITFIAAWNEFIIALSMVNKKEMQTATVSISKFTGAYGFDQPFGTQMAAGVIVTVPLVIVVLIFQRRIVAGLTAGGVK